MPGFGDHKAEKIKQRGESTATRLVEEAIKLHKAGEIDKAELLYLQAISSGIKHEIIFSNLGVLYKRSNRSDQAIAVYERAISLNPGFADAHANLGGLLQEQGHYEKAYQSLCKAIQLDPQHAIAYSNLGLTLQSKGKHQQAIDNALKAISLNPGLASTHTNLGTILKEQGQLEQAITATSEAIKRDPNYVPAYISLGIIQKELGNLDAALTTIIQAQKLKTDYAPTYIVMGNIFQERGQLKEAIHATQQAINLDPSNASGYINLGIMLQGQDQFIEAITATQKAISLDPHNAMAYRSLGAICRDKGDMKSALTATLKSISINPNDSVAYMNLGCIYAELCDYVQAEHYCKKAVEMDPCSVGAQVNLSQFQLLRHDYKNGWKNYKNRKQKTIITVNDQRSIDSISPTDISQTSNIFVAGEQGVGDQILFASLLHQLQLKCKQVFVAVDERLVPLFQRSFSGNISFYPDNIDLPGLPIDICMSMGDLGAMFRQEKSDFNSQPLRYLSADVQKVKAISTKIKSKSDIKAIGLSWHSAGRRYFNRKKSIPLDDLASALANSHVDLIKLQYGDCANEIARTRESHKLEIREFSQLDITNDIDGLAALISACDEVVTISNVTAHLAGALGKQTHLLAPASPHFYWGIDESTTVWYPSVKIYRQTKDGSWKSAFNQLADVLRH